MPAPNIAMKPTPRDGGVVTPRGAAFRGRDTRKSFKFR
jgi:hypothetical protein